MNIKYLLEEIFPYLVILYLLDCVTFVKHYEFLLVSYFKRFKIKISGFHLTDLSPLGETFSCYDFPFWFTRDGLYFSAQNGHHAYEEEDFHFLAFHEIKQLEADGKMIRVNGKDCFAIPSAVGASHAIGMIGDLKDLDPPTRYEKIKTWLEDMTDPEQVRALRVNSASSFFILRIISSLLFIQTFVLLPLVLYCQTYRFLNFSPFGFLIGANYLLAVVFAYSLRRKIYGEKVEKKVSAILPIILSPVCAIHVVGKLTREIYARFDYHAVAAQLLRPEDFLDLMRRDLYQIKCRKVQSRSEELIEFLTLKENAWHGLLNKRGVTVEELWAPPEKQCETAASFCPICRCEYRAGFHKCSDCGVELREFDPLPGLRMRVTPLTLPE